MGSGNEEEASDEAPDTADLLKLMGQIIRKLKDQAALGAIGLLFAAGIISVWTREPLIVFVSAVVLALGLMVLSGFKIWTDMHIAMKRLDRKVESGMASADVKLARRRSRKPVHLPPSDSVG